MMERRPHWDIDLVDGVGRRLIPRYRSIGYCTDAERHRIYTLIEFVEDWMDANDNPLPHVLNECLQWLDAERAAIARVRELHRPCSDPHLHDGGRCCLECSDYGRQGVVRMYPCDTIRALDDNNNKGVIMTDNDALNQTRDALHTAFTIIANARNCLDNGDRDPVLAEQWHEAAQRFMQDYNANLDVYIGGSDE